MKINMDIFLKAKHWQLALITLVIFFLQTRFLYGTVFGHTLFFLLPLLGWIWAVSVNLQNKIPKDIKMKEKRFKFWFIFTTLWFLIVQPIMLIIQDQILTAVLLPIGIFAFFGIVFLISFAARTIGTIETQAKAKALEVTMYSFAILFPYIGIWFIQPKVNKAFQQKDLR